jgi:hypothetical protein
MNPKSGMNILAVLALLVNIGACIILFGSLKNLSQGLTQAGMLSFISIIVIIIFSFLLFLMFMLSRSNRQEEETNSEIKAQEEKEKNQGSYDSSLETTYNLEELKNKAVQIIPKDALLPGKNYTLKNFADESLIQLSKIIPIVEGVFFIRVNGSDEFNVAGDYAYFSESKPSGFKLGETLPGQVAKNKRAMTVSDIPEDYVKIGSGLGKGSPGYLYFIPLLKNEETIAVLEIASFKEFGKESQTLFELAANELSEVLVQLQTRNL